MLRLAWGTNLSIRTETVKVPRYKLIITMFDRELQDFGSAVLDSVTDSIKFINHSIEWKLSVPMFEPADLYFSFDKYFMRKKRKIERLIYPGSLGNQNYDYLMDYRGFKIYADVFYERIVVYGGDRFLSYETELSDSDFRSLEVWRYPDRVYLLVELALSFVDNFLAEQEPEGQLELDAVLKDYRSNRSWQVGEKLASIPESYRKGQGFCTEYLIIQVPEPEPEPDLA